MILVYSHTVSPRLEYICRLVFSDILGAEVSLTDDRNSFESSGLPRFSYSFRQLGNEPYLESSGFLFDSTLRIPEVVPVPFNGEIGFFPAGNGSLLPFDPLASAFLVVSRLEEYIPGSRDSYGRFEGRSSLLFRNGLLEKPMVNIWAWMLAARLEEIYPHLRFIRKKFRFLSTIDIDSAWTYRNKGFFRQAGAVVRDILSANTPGLQERIRVLAGRRPDPSGSYAYLSSVYAASRDSVIFFIHVGDYGKYDKPVSWKNSEFRELVRKISASFQVGLHPSFRSSESSTPARLLAEKERLLSLTGEPVSRSRQHYLRLQFPESYRRLVQAGIMEDYTMGFADMAGFRAGICTPFRFYDLGMEKETCLTVIPFQMMDVTLAGYMKLSPDEAIRKTDDLMRQVKKVGGIFSAVWHNESVSGAHGWKDYVAVFESMNNLGFAYAKE